MKRVLLGVSVSALLGLNGIALATSNTETDAQPANTEANNSQSYQIGNEANAQAAASAADAANQPQQLATEDQVEAQPAGQPTQSAY